MSFAQPHYISHSAALFAPLIRLFRITQARVLAALNPQKRANALALVSRPTSVPVQSLPMQSLPMQSFLAGATEGALTPGSTAAGGILPGEAAMPEGDRESVKLLVIGSRHGITTIMQTLYRLGFAEISEWGPLLPGPNPGEVMSILTRSILRS